jgi:quercetin dioxygenase-like cupin family protein
MKATIAALAFAAALPAAAQAPVPRSFEASPEVYKVIAENPKYRVISVVWKPGQKDAPHGHPDSAVYYLSDCAMRLTGADGSTRDVNPKAGHAVVQNPILSHTVENIGSADCRLVMFEPR